MDILRYLSGYLQRVPILMQKVGGLPSLATPIYSPYILSVLRKLTSACIGVDKTMAMYFKRGTCLTLDNMLPHL